jgi:hypothetical protein
LKLNYKIEEGKLIQRATKAFNHTKNWIHSSTIAEVPEVGTSNTMVCHQLQSKQKAEKADVTTTLSLLQSKSSKFIDLQARYKPQKSQISISCCGCISISHCWPPEQ